MIWKFAGTSFCLGGNIIALIYDGIKPVAVIGFILSLAGVIWFGIDFNNILREDKYADYLEDMPDPENKTQSL